MKNTLSLLALVSLQSLIVSAFSPASTLQGGRTFSCHEQTTRVQAATATAPTDTDAKVQVKTEVPVSRISVCAGELCQCQGEQYEYTGGAADAAIEELQSLGLPFPVDEVGCLGACGMGTMIAIDFENGDSIMTDGLQSTLVELGIQQQNAPPEDGIGNEGVASSSVEAAASVPNMASATTTFTEEKTKTKKPPMLADPRGRMREEAADIEVKNPWVNMASYLAKKATGKLFGSE